ENSMSDVPESIQEEPEDRFQTVMAIMIAVVALITAFAAWRGSLAGSLAGFEDYYALNATLNSAETRSLNTAAAYQNYHAFTNYQVNNALALMWESSLEQITDEGEKAWVQAQVDEASKLATTNLNFFQSRYINKEGDYLIQRQLDESWAEAQRRMDLNTDAHLEKSGNYDTRSFSFVTNAILLAVSLLFYSLASILHAGRRGLRWGAASVGTLCLLVSIVSMILTEVK
ncbi:MAG TPA: hypothetical protein VFF78_02585, partial [Anaerolineaceae bacterium]|nr:hypothetical protein [Anaerolineaceae bacterium]